METDMTREEAIKEMREKLPWLTEDTKRLVETLIPELRESEDERIRNQIMEFISSADISDFVSENQQAEWYHWLEKQKAKERLDRMAPIYNDKESFESALEKGWKYYNESASRKVDSFEDDYIECVFSKGFREGFLYKEKQKEQKPAEEIPAPNDVFKFNLESCLYNFGKRIAADCLDTHDLDEKLNLYVTMDKVRRHLPFYLDAIQKACWKQKPTEWSEEDERMRNELITIMNGGKVTSGTYLSEYAAWLKSLRPSWKPSEEQMTALKAINLEGAISYVGQQNDLISLYNDLKKLM